MAKRFSKNDVKIGEEVDGLIVAHRFMLDGEKCYVVKDDNGELTVRYGTRD